MRYTRVSIASYAIAGVLLLVAVGVGWSRSRDSREAVTRGGDSVSAGTETSIATTTSTPNVPESAAAVASASEAAADAPIVVADSTIYVRDCGSCHGAGEARGQRIPPLRAYTVELFAAEGGRNYLVDLFFDGRVRVVRNGTVTFRQTHPGFADLTNAEIASVLNYMLTAWGNDKLLPKGTRMYTAAEVGRRRPKR